MIAALLTVRLAASAASPTSCVDASSELLRAGKHEDAAAAAERCWQAAGDPQALLIAAQAWIHRQYHAHAARALEQVVERADELPWSREGIAELQNRIHRNTTELELAFDPPLRPDERVWFGLEYLDAERPILTAKTGARAFRLDAGRWRLTVRRDGYADWSEDLPVAREAIRRTAYTRPLAGPPVLPIVVPATRIHLGPTRALRRGVTLQLRPADVPHAPAFTLPTTDAIVALHLPAGRWHLQLSAPGHATVKATVTAGDAAVHLHLLRGTAP